MKRTIDSIKENEVIWCKSPEEAEKFCKLIANRVMYSGSKYIDFKNVHIGYLCYNLHNGQYASKHYYESSHLSGRNYTIIPATEFIEDEETSPIQKCIEFANYIAEYWQFNGRPGYWDSLELTPKRNSKYLVDSTEELYKKFEEWKRK